VEVDAIKCIVVFAQDYEQVQISSCAFISDGSASISDDAKDVCILFEARNEGCGGHGIEDRRLRIERLA
jgi:hypothetical protein